MKIILICLVIFLLCCAVDCGRGVLGEPLRVYNNSNHNITIIFSISPVDTTLPEKFILDDFYDARYIEPGSEWQYSIFMDNYDDNFSIFVIHTDTLSKYSWEEIRNEYKILKRYDVNFKVLPEKEGWSRIHYPPTESERNIKQFPPFEEDSDD